MEEAGVAYGVIPKYVQYAVTEQLQWRLRSDGELAKAVIGEEGFCECQRLVRKLVKRINLDVIMGQKQLFASISFIWGMSGRMVKPIGYIRTRT